MDDVKVYVSITESTAYGARDRVVDGLNALTNGNADRAIKCVKEFMELDGICKEIEERKEKN